MTTIAPLAVPTVPFSDVARRVDRLWDPYERNVHHTIIAPTGWGKSYLIKHILALRPTARTLIVDVKANRDQTWQGYGQPVTELPAAFAREGTGPSGMCYRLSVNRSEGKSQVRRALEQVRDEGHCIVVIDESRSVTEREQFGLGSLVENLILEGRGIGITVILGAQSLAWSVSAIKDQPAAVWIGRQRNAKQARALAEMVGYGRELDPTIRSVPPRHWLYSDAWTETPILGITTIGPRV